MYHQKIAGKRGPKIELCILVRENECNKHLFPSDNRNNRIVLAFTYERKVGKDEVEITSKAYQPFFFNFTSSFYPKFHFHFPVKD